MLMSSAQLANFNIVLRRKIIMAQMISESQVCMTPRNGYSGIGMIVEMPTAGCTEQQVPGPVLDWVFSVWVLEIPALNFAVAQTNRPAKGTQVAC